MNGNPLTGGNYLLQGFSLMTQKSLRLYVLIPMTINLVLFASFLVTAYAYISSWIDSVLGWLPSWLSFLSWVLWPMAIVMVLSIVMYGFSIIANLVASSFNTLLAEKTEEYLTGKELPGYESITKALLSLPKGMVRELQKILYYIPYALAVLVISFIPVINLIAPLLWFLLGAWMMAIQYGDHPLDNHQQGFAATKKAIGKQRLTSAGFGAAVMVGTMIPVVNFIIIPAAVCGATKYWVESMRGDFTS